MYMQRHTDVSRKMLAYGKHHVKAKRESAPEHLKAVTCTSTVRRTYELDEVPPVAGCAVVDVHLRVAGAGEAEDVPLAGHVEGHVQQHGCGALLVQLQRMEQRYVR